MDEFPSVPGEGPRTKVRVVPTGWDNLLWILLPSHVFARRVARMQIEVYGGKNPLVVTPLFLLQLPDGSYWKVIDASKNGVLDLDAVPYEAPGGS